MARIIAVSSGCTTLTWPSGTTLPSATATMSICDSEAQISAAAISPHSAHAVNRSVSDSGVSISSIVAGRNSRSSAVSFRTTLNGAGGLGAGAEAFGEASVGRKGIGCTIALTPPPGVRDWERQDRCHLAPLAGTGRRAAPGEGDYPQVRPCG